jgi:hypothetical protein
MRFRAIAVVVAVIAEIDLQDFPQFLQQGEKLVYGRWTDGRKLRFEPLIESRRVWVPFTGRDQAHQRQSLRGQAIALVTQFGDELVIAGLRFSHGGLCLVDNDSQLVVSVSCPADYGNSGITGRRGQMRTALVGLTQPGLWQCGQPVHSGWALPHLPGEIDKLSFDAGAECISRSWVTMGVPSRKRMRPIGFSACFISSMALLCRFVKGGTPSVVAHFRMHHILADGCQLIGQQAFQGRKHFFVALRNGFSVVWWKEQGGRWGGATGVPSQRHARVSGDVPSQPLWIMNLRNYSSTFASK